MMICIIELGSGLLACSLATLRPLLASLVDMTAQSRYSLSNIFSRSPPLSMGNDGTAISPPSNKQKNNDLSTLRSQTRDLESGEDNELETFESKGATILSTERGRSEGSDVSLVYQK